MDAQRHVVAPVTGPQIMISLSDVLACVTRCCVRGSSTAADVCCRLSQEHGARMPDIKPYLDALAGKGYITIRGNDIALT